jgi:heptaprenyl diphosphate synthase
MIKTRNNLPERLPLPEARQAAAGMITDTLQNASRSAADILSHLAQAQGKGVRALLLLTCAADSELSVPTEAIYAAVSVELFHMATLVHDDVIDNSPTRRGLESVQSKFGQKRAVIIGDYLLCLSLDAANEVLRHFARREEYERGYNLAEKYLPSLTNICLGEYKELLSSANLGLSPREYLKIISGKTAEMFRLSAVAGAEIGGADAQTSAKTGRFGLYLGLIFQIVDDCKDYTFSAEAAQKPVKQDLLQGVVTLPLILAMLKDPELRPHALSVMRRKEDTADFVRHVLDCGGVDEAQAIAARYADKASQILDMLYTGHKRDELGAILNSALNASSRFA